MKLLVLPFKLVWWLVKLPFLILKLLLMLIPKNVKSDFRNGRVKGGFFGN